MVCACESGAPMILADFLPAVRDRSWDLALQVGVRHAICKCAPEFTGLKAPDDLDSLRIIQRRFAEAGLRLIGLEGDQFDMGRIKQGLPGRDEDLERYRRMLANLGELGIPLLCYNFMAVIGWFRTATDLGLRGGALSSAFSAAAAARQPLVPEAQRIDHERLWENYASFVRAVVPAAETAGVSMGLHPDDPPVPVLRGVGRIFTSPAAIDRALALSDSPAHQLTFCQATYAAMGADPLALARRWAGRIAFVHFRDVAGTAEDFREVFHDEGPTDMAAMVRTYGETGITGPVRVDHVPTMAGENNADHGYAHLGRLFAIGYLRGLCDAQGVELR
jgi:mannonate dehydratase